ncbi:pathogenesis-related homeodomain protein [Cucurbita pepo subsp. pepo]|uniref:pathogenesis-related homeodomain protein n=1 Tax=Cucurbita pepo subsp. pepo TaxID=3664 RepID=UPI000C9D735C|nr:pathogenesis-related homeodomain protein [Cucurbita pepo subsp. pepo]XP_023531701.1 pathogenesis-related homeodomain protein [Cucurbita pepo subsp. pepo]
MKGTGRRLTQKESGKCSHSKMETGSELILPLKLKRCSKISHSKQKKSRTKSHAQEIGSTLKKRPFPKSLSKGNKNVTIRQMAGKKFLLKKLNSKYTKDLLLSKLQGGKSLPSSSTEGNAEKVEPVTKINQQRKRSKNKGKREKLELDEASRLQRRTRYLIIKMKLEQNLIDAYSGEGWKGQSREKIRPEKELQRAMKQILQCKLGIRDAIRQLDLLGSVGCIEDSVIGPDGSVYHEHIFCAKCKLREAFPDNDIILCDGTCNCAFHQKCLDPPLDTENIPPGDQGWFCKFCECKMEILEGMNAHLGTRFSMNVSWEDIFKEEAAFPDGRNASLNHEEDWPSDDSADDDYDPDKKEIGYDNLSGEENDKDVFEESSSSTSLSWSLDGEDLTDRDGIGCEDHFGASSSIVSDGSNEEGITGGRRQRQAVDYKKLYVEMFGKDSTAHEQVSEDEDWGPAKRRRREKECDAASTLMSLCESEKKSPKIDVEAEKRPLNSQSRSFFRIPLYAVEKLRQVFAENELPSREVKENLSIELGLDAEKVSKWFKNARYSALRTRKAEGATQSHSPNKTLNEPRLADSKEMSACPPSSEDAPIKELQLKSRNSRYKKKQHRKSSLVSSNNNKDALDLGDDISLKNLLKNRKTKVKKRVKFVARGGGGGRGQEAEVEMERLCKIKGRLQIMKQKLLRLSNKKEDGILDRSHMFEQSIVYVPVAVLKEKV